MLSRPSLFCGRTQVLPAGRYHAVAVALGIDGAQPLEAEDWLAGEPTATIRYFYLMLKPRPLDPLRLVDHENRNFGREHGAVSVAKPWDRTIITPCILPSALRASVAVHNRFWRFRPCRCAPCMDAQVSQAQDEQERHPHPAPPAGAHSTILNRGF